VSALGDFLVAFGALCFWACVAIVIAWLGAIAYRRLAGRLLARPEPHPGYVPEEVTRSFREPFDRERLPESGLTTEQLDRWPVLDREPRP
jgi:hypothetical protein